MRALIYLILTRMKNSIKSFFKSPARIVLTVLMAALFAMLLLTGGSGPVPDARGADELGAMVFALYFVMFVLCVKSGLNNGASFFTMSDVNNLFPAPIAPKRVLIYGLVRQLGMTFMMAFFLIYQYGWLHSVYGVSIVGLLGLLVGYMLTVFCGQLVAMGVYAWTSGDERRKRLVRVMLYAAAALVALLVVRGVLSAQDKLAAAVTGANSPWVDWLPVAGWLRLFAMGVVTGSWSVVGLGLGLTSAFIALFALLIMNLDSDFYEDVLVAAETTQSAITAQKEGRVAESAPVRVRVGKVGLGGGFGASAFFFKHRLENRRSRVFLMDATGLIFLAMSCGMAWFTRDSGMLPAFLFNLYMLVFAFFTGRWARELTYPYIYLLPEPPFKKIVMLCAETMVKTAAESVLSMALVGLIVGAPAPMVLACIFTRWCFSLYFIASDVLTDRLFGSLPRAMQVLFFFLLLLIIAVPGVVAAFLVAALGGLALGICAAGLWLAAVSALVLFLCRNLLNNAELNT